METALTLESPVFSLGRKPENGLLGMSFPGLWGRMANQMNRWIVHSLLYQSHHGRGFPAEGILPFPGFNGLVWGNSLKIPVQHGFELCAEPR